MNPPIPHAGKAARISLVGAGPGDPDLMTVKAVRCLHEADLVLYDALVSPAVLELIPTHVPAWSVGKRAGAHAFRQDEINTLMVEFALQYGHVVRLKGGDPFVFGRGQEEIAFAQAQGIPVAVIPGITSALAVPASLNIPLTRREVSESFWVVTGTTTSGEVSEDLHLAARSTATVVILMGVHQLEKIVAIFEQYGKSQTPVAVIQNGTLDAQQQVIAPVTDIVQAVKENNIGAPAVIVVGEVVRYATGTGLADLLMARGISAAR